MECQDYLISKIKAKLAFISNTLLFINDDVLGISRNREGLSCIIDDLITDIDKLEMTINDVKALENGGFLNVDNDDEF